MSCCRCLMRRIRSLEAQIALLQSQISALTTTDVSAQLALITSQITSLGGNINGNLTTINSLSELVSSIVSQIAVLNIPTPSIGMISVNNAGVEIGAVPFDTFTIPTVGNTISYNSDTRRFTILESGYYSVSFYVICNTVTQGSTDVNFGMFMGESIYYADYNETFESQANTIMSRTEIIYVPEQISELWIQFNNTPNLVLSNEPVQARIAIVKIA